MANRVFPDGDSLQAVINELSAIQERLTNGVSAAIDSAARDYDLAAKRLKAIRERGGYETEGLDIATLETTLAGAVRDLGRIEVVKPLFKPENN